MPDAKNEAPELAPVAARKAAPEVTNGEGWVVMHHAEIDGYTEVVVDAVEDYESRGWKLAAEYVDPSADAKSTVNK